MQEKGFDQDQFYSNIVIENSGMGVTATVTAYADTSDIAKIAALVFLGRMTDILILDNNIPLVLQASEDRAHYTKKFSTRRLLDKKDVIAAFNLARFLENEHPTLLKAIGWYAKGKTSNNTLDSFLAFWNAIEITATTYHTKTERTKHGTINKIYQCFIDYFGEPQYWDVPERWIKEMHDRRSRIAHGAEETTAEAINEVSLLIPKLADISRKLINEVLESEYGYDVFDLSRGIAEF